MPIYEYKCQDCDERFEKMTSIAKADDTPCEKCGSDNTNRLLSVFGVTSSTPTSPCAGGACEMPSAGPSACQGCPCAGG